MKTLLTEKEVYELHKGDNHSARTKMKIGEVVMKRFGFYVCVDKIIFKIDTCPHCKSKNSFHKRQQSDPSRQYDNVYRAWKDESDRSLVFHKVDYCLDCHKEFHIEIFCYKKISILDLLKKR